MQFLISRTGRPFPMYRASSSWIPGTSFSEIATFRAGTKRVHVTRIWVSVSQSANGLVVFRIYRKTADNVGGTSSNVVPCKHETLDTAPTAFLRAYTRIPLAPKTGRSGPPQSYSPVAASRPGRLSGSLPQRPQRASSWLQGRCWGFVLGTWIRRGHSTAR